MKDKFTIMLPVSRTNLPLANACITHLINTTNINIIVVDDNGNDSEYISHPNVSFIHTQTSERRALVKIWNQCIRECPTEYVILASWRQRPTPEHFKVIEEKLNEGFGVVCFDSLHFFAFSKHLTTVIGFFDEGFTKGQFEDSDFFNRLRINDIGIFCGDIPEERNFRGREVLSMWLDPSKTNEIYYNQKWTEDRPSGTLILKKNEVNFEDRKMYQGNFSDRSYKNWNESVLPDNLKNFFTLYNKFKTTI